MSLGRYGLESGGGVASSLSPGATGTTLTLRPSDPFIGWIGDSISIASTGNAPAQYMKLTEHNVQNWAISGQRWTTGAIGNEYTTNVTTQTKIVCQGGVNDIIGGVSAATIAGTSLAFVDARLAEGKTVVLNNVGPWAGNFQWSGALQVVTLAYNALLLAALVSRPTLILLDLYTLLENPPGSGLLRAAYDSGDGLHENSTGGAAWATQMAIQLP